MAHQEDGWPLGLQPLNARVGLVRNRDINGSVSFNTLLTGSPTSATDSSSDLDTESTGSFFHDKSITLGSLIGLSSILEFSEGSMRTAEPSKEKNIKSRPWLFSLCSKLSTDAISTKNGTPLGQFLEVERRAANNYRRNHSPNAYGPDDFVNAPPPGSDLNSLFAGGQVAPPGINSWLDSEGERRGSRNLLQHGNGYGTPLFFSCLCGQITQ